MPTVGNQCRASSLLAHLTGAQRNVKRFEWYGSVCGKLNDHGKLGQKMLPVRSTTYTRATHSRVPALLSLTHHLRVLVLGTEARPSINLSVRWMLVAPDCFAAFVVHINHARLLVQGAELGFVTRESCGHTEGNTNEDIGLEVTHHARIDLPRAESVDGSEFATHKRD